MIRSFIAIELGQELKSLLAQVEAQLETRLPPRTVRWVQPAAMHLTLVFLGDIAPASVAGVAEAMTRVTTGFAPITGTIHGLGCFPNTRRPRVVWVGIDEPANRLSQLKLALDRALEPLSFKPEQRPFSPHLTLGRVHKQAGKPDVQRLGQVIENATLHELAQLTADQIHLIRSDLRPAGPIYSRLASAPLSGS